MAWFEVFIPGKAAGTPSITLTVEAPNWIGALRTGLQNIGEGQESISNVMCDIKEDNSIHVTDVASHRVFRLRETRQPSVAVPAAVPPPPADDELNPPTMLDGSNAAAPPSTTTEPVIADAPTRPSARPVGLEQPLGQHTLEMAAAPMPAPAPKQPALSPSLAAQLSSTLTAPTALDIPTATTAPPPELTMPLPAARPLPVEVPAPAPTVPTPSTTTGATAKTVALPTTEPSTTLPQPPPNAVPPTPAPKPAKAPVVEATERLPRSPGPVSPPTPRGVAAPPPKRVTGQFENAPRPVSREVTRDEVAAVGRAPSTAEQAAISDALADVFDATQDLLLETRIDPQRIASSLLDIALAHVPAESGTFYIADVNGHELRFAAVRGPKADAIKKGNFTVPVGQGIVGFCALEGICLGVTDIQKDPRYFSGVADAVGYTPRDTLCASAEKDGRLFGAVQLINAKQGFTTTHMEVLRYIGLTAAQLLERHFNES